jgi:hypothetical protein
VLTGTRGPPPPPGNPINPVRPNEASTFLSATAVSSLYVVAARASADTVAAFGPPLPAEASLYDATQLTVSADNSRVALVLRAKVGTPRGHEQQAAIARIIDLTRRHAVGARGARSVSTRADGQHGWTA